MNYRHAYHAGNPADVLKHLTLIALLERLLVKDTALHYFDTHAGRGRYRLDSQESLASGEADQGIAKLRAARLTVPLLDEYFRLIDNERAFFGPSAYPGSPAIAAQLLRSIDRMTFAELERSEAQLLKSEFGDDPRVTIKSVDGYGLLKADLPPKERRGLVLIDSPFERQAEEFKVILAALAEAHARFAHGVFAIWYPIKIRSEVDGFVRSARSRFARPALRIDLTLYPATTANRLNGSGMLIFNPPFELERRLEPALGACAKILSAQSLKLEHLAVAIPVR